MIMSPVRAGSPDAETYRSLRATLAYSKLPEGRRVVLMTSARAGEGKSTTAANLAAVCADAERRTLLVDADLRNPELGRLFGLADAQGLATLLGGASEATIDTTAFRTPIPFLDILPVGRLAGTVPGLLARPQLATIFEEARALYDWVVVDSPPVLPVADALVLSRHVDGVIVVVDVRATSMETARRACELLRAVGAPLVGVVANRSHARAASAGYGRYPG